MYTRKENKTLMPKLNIRFNAKSGVAKYQQVADQISAMITTDKLKDGDRLPSDRALAEQAGVSRTTVIEAYTLLKDKKLISALSTMGTIVGRAKSSQTSKREANKREVSKRSAAQKTAAKKKR